MARSILATPDELAGLGTIGDVQVWAGAPTSLWQIANTSLGQVPSLRVLAHTPSEFYRSMLSVMLST